jgi:hypothetical protein
LKTEANSSKLFDIICSLLKDKYKYQLAEIGLFGQKYYRASAPKGTDIVIGHDKGNCALMVRYHKKNELITFAPKLHP